MNHRACGKVQYLSERERMFKSVVRFDLTFARARTYRVWVQFQRNEVVSTALFDIPVKD